MMDAEKYNRSVSLQCPTCGGTQFEHEDTDGESKPVRCPACGYTATKDELIQANQENIDLQLEEIKDQVLNDLTKSFKDAFRGNKFIKIK